MHGFGTVGEFVMPVRSGLDGRGLDTAMGALV